uniref:Uncharacterized protein n=1 Tax=Setaria italica TaxID=4555 RepID=K3ZP81_SETIT
MSFTIRGISIEHSRLKEFHFLYCLRVSCKVNLEPC